MKCEHFVLNHTDVQSHRTFICMYVCMHACMYVRTYVRCMHPYSQNFQTANGPRRETKSSLVRKCDESSCKCLDPITRHKKLITTCSKTTDANTPPPDQKIVLHPHKHSVGSFAVTRYLKRNKPQICPMAGVSISDQTTLIIL